MRLTRLIPPALRAPLRACATEVERAFVRALTGVASAPTPDATSVAVIGFDRTALGLGNAGRLTQAELAAAGVPARGVFVDRALSLVGPRVDLRPAPGEALLFQVNPDVLPRVLHKIGPSNLARRRRIGYWAWELERAPAMWNRWAPLMHDIWAPSRFVADALSRSFDREVSAVPHAVALAPIAMPTREQARTHFGFSERDFVVVTSFSGASSFARKNPLEAIRAFRKAFSGADDALLVVRCIHHPEHDRLVARLLEEGAAAGARVLVLTREHAAASLPEMEALYAACDCYVSLHRSEGFGLNIAEALLRGIPTIATGWSGNLDYMSDEGSFLVPAELVEVEDEQQLYSLPSARWAAPDLDAAAAHLRAIASDLPGAKRRAASGRELALMTLSGGHARAALWPPALNDAPDRAL